MSRKSNVDKDLAVEQALNLFWAQGYHATSMKDLEHALNMRPGSFYAAFGSKSALYCAALVRYADKVSDRLFEAAERYGPVAALSAHIRNATPRQDRPAQVCFLTKTVLEAPDDAVSTVAFDQLRRIEAAYANLIRLAQETAGVALTQDASTAAAKVHMQVTGLRTFAQISAEPSRVQAMAEEQARLFETQFAKVQAKTPQPMPPQPMPASRPSITPPLTPEAVGRSRMHPPLMPRVPDEDA